MRFPLDNQSVNLGYFYHPFLSVKSKFTFVEGAKMLVSMFSSITHVCFVLSSEKLRDLFCKVKHTIAFFNDLIQSGEKM